MLALYEQGLGSSPSNVYREMDGVSALHEETPGAHVTNRVPDQMPPFDFMDRVPKQFAPKLLKGNTGRPDPKAHIRLSG
jgi:hypothetical protein